MTCLFSAPDINQISVDKITAITREDFKKGRKRLRSTSNAVI